MLAALALLTALPAALRVPPLIKQRLIIGEAFAKGQYGKVHYAKWEELDAVAKCAAAANSEDAELARAYLKVEREVNEAIRASGDTEQRFCKFLGAEDDFLAWELLPGAVELIDFAGAAPLLYAEHGLTLRQCLRQLLECTAALHELGYIHRDIKLENCLLATQPPPSSLRLIDMGSAVLVLGIPTHEPCSSLSPTHHED